jgi:hypothetical protein
MMWVIEAQPPDNVSVVSVKKRVDMPGRGARDKEQHSTPRFPWYRQELVPYYLDVAPVSPVRKERAFLGTIINLWGFFHVALQKGTQMSATAVQLVGPPSKILMFLEGRALHEFGALLSVIPLLNLAAKGDGHPVMIQRYLCANF